jgi:hypothetical protein
MHLVLKVALFPLALVVWISLFLIGFTREAALRILFAAQTTLILFVAAVFYNSRDLYYCAGFAAGFELMLFILFASLNDYSNMHRQVSVFEKYKESLIDVTKNGTLNRLLEVEKARSSNAYLKLFRSGRFKFLIFAYSGKKIFPGGGFALPVRTGVSAIILSRPMAELTPEEEFIVLHELAHIRGDITHLASVRQYLIRMAVFAGAMLAFQHSVYFYIALVIFVLAALFHSIPVFCAREVSADTIAATNLVALRGQEAASRVVENIVGAFKDQRTWLQKDLSKRSSFLNILLLSRRAQVLELLLKKED